MSERYYNTTKEPKEIRIKSEKNAKKQEDLILAIFRHFIDKPMTASDAWKKSGLMDNNTPLTSIRRAITNLEKKGKLEKTDILKDGLYGSPQESLLL